MKEDKQLKLSRAVLSALTEARVASGNWGKGARNKGVLEEVSWVQK